MLRSTTVRNVVACGWIGGELDKIIEYSDRELLPVAPQPGAQNVSESYGHHGGQVAKILPQEELLGGNL